MYHFSKYAAFGSPAMQAKIRQEVAQMKKNDILDPQRWSRSRILSGSTAPIKRTAGSVSDAYHAANPGARAKQEARSRMFGQYGRY